MEDGALPPQPTKNPVNLCSNQPIFREPSGRLPGFLFSKGALPVPEARAAALTQYKGPKMDFKKQEE